jgi:tetraacyldisaccharide 4'-kinase
VLSVGNLAVGGTGKTPFTAWLAAGLHRRGRHPGILSRGYGPRAADGGLSDEGAVLRRALGDQVPQREDPDRWRSGQRLLAERPELDVLLLDDGFQHWQLARDLDIVLLDATRPLGYGHLLPRGLLRESPRALARAGVVVVTRAEQVDDDALAAIRARVAGLTSAVVAVARSRPSGVEVAGVTHPPGWVRGRRVFAVCGIGNPEVFVAHLEALGAAVVGRRFLADHAAPSDADWTGMREQAWAAGAQLVVTTRKDAVKLAALPTDVAVYDVATHLEEGEAELWAAVERVL